MKKLYTILLLTVFGNTVMSQYLTKDFSDLSLNSGGWTTQIIIDTTNWFVTSYAGDDFIKATNYNNGANVPANTWFISPGVDLSSATQPILSFQTIMKWTGAALVLHVSTDYDGTSNPTQQGTWTDITTSATWDTDNTTWGNWTNSGDVDLTSYISSSTYIAFEYLGSSSSGSTWEIDNILINEGSAPPPTVDTLSVYDIQYTADPNGDSPYMGQQVVTGGIVTAFGSDSSFYIGSGNGAWSGVYVYSTSYILNVGDSVIFDAEVDEFYNLTELKNISNLQVISTGNTPVVNNCTTAAANTEDFEGCLVQVTNAQCNNDNAGFGEWVVNDGSGDMTIDDLLFSYTPILNTNYNVTGPVTYNYSVFKILPRDANDVSQFIGISDSDLPEFRFYPNPAAHNEAVTFNLKEDTKIEFYNLSGKLLESVFLYSGNQTLNIDFLSSGTYILKANGIAYSLSVL